jgi:chromosome segregation ATPase
MELTWIDEELERLDLERRYYNDRRERDKNAELIERILELQKRRAELQDPREELLKKLPFLEFWWNDAQSNYQFRKERGADTRDSEKELNRTWSDLNSALLRLSWLPKEIN